MKSVAFRGCESDHSLFTTRNYDMMPIYSWNILSNLYRSNFVSVVESKKALRSSFRSQHPVSTEPTLLVDVPCLRKAYKRLTCAAIERNN